MKDMPLKGNICMDLQGGVLYVQSYTISYVFGIFNSLLSQELIELLYVCNSLITTVIKGHSV